jgi:hypothetical protein
MGFLIFVGIRNPYRYLGLVFLVFGILYFIWILLSKKNHSDDDSLKSRTRDQVDKFRRKQ